MTEQPKKKTRTIVKAVCNRCQGTGKTKHHNRDEMIKCYKCQGKGFLRYQDLPPPMLAMLRDNMARAREQKDRNDVKRMLRRLELKVNVQERRHRMMLDFFYRMFRIVEYQRKHYSKVKISELVGFMDAIVRKDVWKELHKLDEEIKQEKEMKEKNKIADSVDLIQELLDKKV